MADKHDILLEMVGDGAIVVWRNAKFGSLRLCPACWIKLQKLGLDHDKYTDNNDYNPLPYCLVVCL